eukprot:2040288-Lingulodinium_polyedra.AAC.1
MSLKVLSISSMLLVANFATTPDELPISRAMPCHRTIACCSPSDADWMSWRILIFRSRRAAAALLVSSGGLVLFLSTAEA